MPIKIAMFSYLPPILGGVATHTYEICKELIRRGHEIHVISFNSKNKGDYVLDGINVHGLPSSLDLGGLYSVGTHMQLDQTKKLLKKINPDLIHLHHKTSTIEFSMQDLRKALQKPMVSTVHFSAGSLSLVDFYEIYHLVHYAFLSNELKGADRVIAVSDFNKNKLIERGCPKDIITTISNGTHTERFTGISRTQARKRLGINKSTPVFLFAARHSPEKGIDVLIFAFKKLLEKMPNAKLYILGDGLFSPLYKQFASGMSNIIFTGYVSNKLLPYYYRAADIFVLPSVWEEPQGIVLLDAMSAKIPVIASNVGGISELVKQSKAGLLVKKRSIEDLEKNMVLLYKNKKLRNKMSESGYEFVKNNCTWEKVVNELEKVYWGVLASQKK